MSKLHQTLAVEKDIGNQKEVILRETIKVMKHAELFIGEKKTLKMFDEDRKIEEAAQATIKALTTTVPERLEYTAEMLVKHLDCVHQKEATNTVAKADIVVDGTVLMKDVPATMLLALEREFAKYRDMFHGIPTLASGVDWERDNDLPGEVMKIKDPIITQKMEQTTEWKSFAVATPQHKEQLKEISISKQVGEYTRQLWSGCITSRRKAEMNNKLESFIQAVKSARAKANDQDIVKPDSIKPVFDWLLT